MKVKTLSLLAGAGSSLLIASSAQAGYTGVRVALMDFSSGYLMDDGSLYSGAQASTVNPLVSGFYGLQSGNFDTYRVYAQFDDAADRLTSVTADTIAWTFDSSAGGFIDLATGAPTPPDISSIDGIFSDSPSLALDTWVTIGAADIQDVPAEAGALVFVGVPSNLSGGLNVAIAAGALIAAPTLSGGADNPLTIPNANGEVLVGQFTMVEGATLIGQGEFAITLNVGGATTAAFVIPAPGAMALLGLAGLVGRPRRRRG